MNSKKQLMIAIVLVMTMVVVTATSTYAFLSTSKEQTNANTLKTATCYGLNFTGGSNVINLVSYPMSNQNGLKTSPYTFSINNKCASTDTYQILLNVKNTTSDKILPYINYSIDGTNVKKLSSLTPVSLTGVTSSDSKGTYLIDTGVLTGSATTKTYNLRLWIDESGGNDLMNSVFKAEVIVYTKAN